MMAAAALGVEIFSQGFRFVPTPHDAVTYYLPRLIAGTPLHDAVRPVVHHADVYACTPAHLARHFCPLPITGDRFFFTPSPCAKRARCAGAAAKASRDGSWHAQNTTDIKGRSGSGGDDDDAKVGELRKLRYKKSGGVYTDWLMDEYSCCSVAAGDGESSRFVLCKMYVSPRAAPTSVAHKESAAYFSFMLQPPRPPPLVAVVMKMQMQPPPAPAAAPKRPAAPPMSPPCAKRMRLRLDPVVQPAGGNDVFFSMPPPPQPSCAPPPVVPTSRSLVAAVGNKMPLAQPHPIRPAMWPQRSPMPVPQQPPLVQQPLPTPPVAHVPVQSKQRTIPDPFEAANMLRDQTVAAAPHPPPPPTATTPALQEQDQDDWDDLDKALEFEAEQTVVAAPHPAPPRPPAATTPALQDQDQDEDDWDDLAKALEFEN